MDRERFLPLEQQLESVVFDGPSAQQAPDQPPAALKDPEIPPAQQLQQRRDAIAALDQRMIDVQPRLGLTFRTPCLVRRFSRHGQCRSAVRSG